MSCRWPGLLKAYGYAVTHNVTLTGKSGNAHQIDVLAEYACPLHTSRLIVEAKAYEHHVGKDVVMKLVSIRRISAWTGRCWQRRPGLQQAR